ncbi:MAG TPA: sucrase ferredoxin [Acidimicrobiales bacterium]|jgi:hypothetical protein|nr:sucrase ferredoxin [Acidimicrobiales bacterium]
MADPVCSAISLAMSEPLQATASQVRNWVLLEHPGAWGPAALRQSSLPEHISSGLARLARTHGFRVLLIRRPERPRDAARQCYVAHSGVRARWIEERVVADVEELLAVDFSPLREGRRVGFGIVRSDPLYLVCTNGRHDPCCANLGRPVARALHGRTSGAVWESSHYGGDRFAGNLVCLPHGLYYGRLTPGDAQRVADDYERGLLDLDHYRGRAGEPFAAQAAEFFVRRQEGLLGVDDLRTTAFRRLAGGMVEVELEGPRGRRFEVRVRVRPADEARLLACRGPGEERPPSYALVELRTP